MPASCRERERERDLYGVPLQILGQIQVRASLAGFGGSTLTGSPVSRYPTTWVRTRLLVTQASTYIVEDPGVFTSV